MHLALLIAQIDHGTGAGMGVIHLVFVAAVVLGGVVFLVVRAVRTGSARRSPTISDRDPARDRERDGRPDS